MLFWIASNLSPPIIPQAKRAIIFVIFHKSFIDYNVSLKMTGVRLEKIGGKIYCEFVNDWE